MLVIQGRLVWTIGSSLFEGKQKRDFNTNMPVMDTEGKPIVEYGFGLAIPKIDPRTNQNSEQFVKIWQALHQEAFTLFPSGQIPPNFAMKFKDGDGIDDKGQPFSKREGYAGHIVLACTTQIPIKFFKFEGGNNIMVSTGIKCGDYVNVQLNIKAHPARGQAKAGLYLNPSAVQWIQAGKEIINTPSGDQIFGQTMPAYCGEIVADTAPAMPNIAQPAAPFNGIPTQQAPAIPTQQAPVNPHYGVLPQNMQPSQTYAPPVGVTPQAPMQAPATGNPMGSTYAPLAAPFNGMPTQQAPAMPSMPTIPR